MKASSLAVNEKLKQQKTTIEKLDGATARLGESLERLVGLLLALGGRLVEAQHESEALGGRRRRERWLAVALVERARVQRRVGAREEHERAGRRERQQVDAVQARLLDGAHVLPRAQRVHDRGAVGRRLRRRVEECR